MVQIIQAQPDDSSHDEILRELAFARMIERGLADVDQVRTVRREETRHEQSRPAYPTQPGRRSIQLYGTCRQWRLSELPRVRS
jgi:hypothetical protein